MLNEAADKLKNGDYNGYQEIMDEIGNTDWSQVKQSLDTSEVVEMENPYPNLTPNQAKTLTNALNRQKDFMSGDQKKVGRLTKKDARIVQSMEESGVEQNSVGGDVQQNYYRSSSKNFTGTTQVLFVKKLTQKMADDHLFPSLFQSGGSYMVVEHQTQLPMVKNLELC